MAVSERDLYQELESVRKGRGGQDPEIRDRLGPALRQICAIDGKMSHGAARKALVAKLTVACNALPADLKMPGRVMFGLEDGYDHRFLGQRQKALADLQRCDVRTIRRRCDEALRLISAHLAEYGPSNFVTQGEGGYDPDVWYVERFKVVLRLDGESPEAFEERTVVSTTDGLARVGQALSIPRSDMEARPRLGVEIEMVYGGRLASTRQPTSNFFVHYIELPTPLNEGDRHTYARIVRIPRGQEMVPRYIYMPLHRCDYFELHVKFDPAALPRVAWVVSEVPESVYVSHQPGKHKVAPNPLGEVALNFNRLRIGFGYGLAWLPK